MEKISFVQIIQPYLGWGEVLQSEGNKLTVKLDMSRLPGKIAFSNNSLARTRYGSIGCYRSGGIGSFRKRQFYCPFHGR